MTPDEERTALLAERVVLDAELATLASALERELPEWAPWFARLNIAHHTQVVRRAQDGRLDEALIWVTHAPVLGDDGAECNADHAGQTVAYPCSVLRAMHSGEGIWSDLVARYPAGWEKWEFEGDDDGDRGTRAGAVGGDVSTLSNIVLACLIPGLLIMWIAVTWLYCWIADERDRKRGKR